MLGCSCSTLVLCQVSTRVSQQVSLQDVNDIYFAVPFTRYPNDEAKKGLVYSLLEASFIVSLLLSGLEMVDIVYRNENIDETFVDKHYVSWVKEPVLGDILRPSIASGFNQSDAGGYEILHCGPAMGLYRVPYTLHLCLDYQGWL